MLLDRSYQTYVFTASCDYWYNWSEGFYYVAEHEDKPTYHVPRSGLMMELVVLKDWLKGQPTNMDDFDEPIGDVATLVAIPVPSWLDCLPMRVIYSR